MSQFNMFISVYVCLFLSEDQLKLGIWRGHHTGRTKRVVSALLAACWRCRLLISPFDLLLTLFRTWKMTNFNLLLGELGLWPPASCRAARLFDPSWTPGGFLYLPTVLVSFTPPWFFVLFAAELIRLPAERPVWDLLTWTFAGWVSVAAVAIGSPRLRSLPTFPPLIGRRCWGGQRKSKGLWDEM